MSFFSRLTDIVTCNLTEILADEADPPAAMRQIINEMQEGLSGAVRSVKTASASAERIQKELDEHSSQIEYWTSRARHELAADNLDQARSALLRKQEIEDVVAGLKLQHRAAVATREHLTTTLRAIEARLAEARRKLWELESGKPALRSAGGNAGGDSIAALDDARREQVEAELEALKHELGGA